MKTKPVSVRLPIELIDRMTRRAESLGLTLHNYLKVLIGVKDHELMLLQELVTRLRTNK